MRKQQTGVMLLEALIAILIFSFGVLGLVGLQSSAIQASRDAQYRSQAAMLADEIIGQMWATNRVGTELQTNFQGDGEQIGPTNVVTDGAIYTTWAAKVGSVLPGVTNALPPTVQVTPAGAPVFGSPPAPTRVTVTIRWRAPNESTATFHSFSINFQIV